MNAATEFDLGPLTWVKGEIDAALDRAGEALGQFREDQDATKLKFCRTHIHQVRGALAIVGLDGVTQVTEALEELLSGLEADGSKATDEMLGVIERAVSSIRQYLDDLMAGEPNQPLRLLPAYRAINEARGAARIRPSDLFFPDLSIRPPKRAEPVARLSPEEFRACLKRERMRFQKGLLSWLRHPGGTLPAQSQTQMLEALAAIEATQETPAARSFWWVSQGFIDALSDPHVAAVQDTRHLCARIDLQIRRLLEGSRNVAERLLRDALYYIGISSPDSGKGLASALRSSFQLESLVPKGEFVQTTAPQELALRRLREVILATEELWNKFCAGSAAALSGFADQAKNCAQATVAVGNTDLKRLGQGLAAVAAWLAEQPSRQSESVAMEVATAILLLQNAQENFKRLGSDFAAQVDLMVARLHACISGEPVSGEEQIPLLDEMSRRAQEKLLMTQVAREIQNNLALIERALDTFFRDPEQGIDTADLDAPIKQVSGALSILGHDKARQSLQSCAAQIKRFGEPGYRPSEADFEVVAQDLSYLGFFVDSLQTGAIDYDQFLRKLRGEEPSEEGSAEEALEAPSEETATVEAEIGRKKEQTQALLAALKQSPEDETLRSQLKRNLQELQVDGDLLADHELAEIAKTALAVLESGAAVTQEIDTALATTLKSPVVEAPAPTAETIKLAQASHEEIDAELLEIFLEEAQEVLSTIASELENLRAQPHDVDTLTNIRRATHTLKGSGRMVGLKDLGEVAWEVEQTLNMWLRQEIEVTPDLLEMIGLERDVFSVWVAELNKKSDQVPDASALVALAVRLRGSGGAPPPKPTTGPAQEAASQQQGAEAAPSAVSADSAAGAPAGASVVQIVEALEPASSGLASVEALSEVTPERVVPGEQPGAERQEELAPEAPAPEIEISFGDFAEPLPEAGTLATPSEQTKAGLVEESAPEAKAEVPPPFEPEKAEPDLSFDFSIDEVPVSAEEGIPSGMSPVGAEAIAELQPAPAEDEALAAVELEEPLESLVLEVEELGTAIPAPEEFAKSEGTEDFGIASGVLEEITLTEGEPGAVDAKVSGTGEAQPAEELEPFASRQELLAGPEQVEALAEEPAALASEPAEAGAAAGETGLPVAEDVESVQVAQTLYDIFLEEARQHLDTLQQTFAEMVSDPKAPTTFAMTRAAHTLGGIAATVGLMPINKVAVSLEHALMRRDSSVQPDSVEGIETIRQSILALEDMFSGLSSQIPPESQPVLIDALEAIFPMPSPQAPQAPEEKAGAVPVPDEKEAAKQDAQIAAVAGVAVRLQDTSLLKDELDEQLLPIFLEEAQDLVQGFAEQLNAWRADIAGVEAPRALARLLHTFKGGARMAGAMNLGEMTHSLETGLEDALRSGQLSLPLLEQIQSGCDTLTWVIERLSAGESLSSLEKVEIAVEAAPKEEKGAEAVAVEAQAVPVKAVPQAPAEHETVERRSQLRVRADLVDRLVNEAGELSIARARIEGEMLSLKASLLDLTENIIRLRRQLREIEIQSETQMQARVQHTQEGKAEFDPLELDRFTRFQELTRFMAESVNDVATVQQSLLKNLDDTNAAIVSQARMTRSLQQDLMSIRMMPFSTQAERLYRIVRQTAKELGKRANLDIRGGHIELDRSVLDKIMAPVEHMLRNSLSHGIEDKSERQAAGKPEVGDILVTLSQEGNEIVLAVSDDGAGLNPAKIRARAESLGLLPPGAQIEDAELFEFIFQPGFSTASAVTQIAGRGVGMDVVKAEVSNLGGRVEIVSALGQGTTFRLYLPLTLTVMQTLMVRAGGVLYAIPSTMIEQVLEVKEERLIAIRNAGQVEWKDNRYPFSFLPHLLGDTESLPESRRRYWILLLRSGAKRVSVLVDELHGNQEVVIKNIGPQLARVVGLAGATVLGDGRVVLILNPVALAGRQPVDSSLLAAGFKAETEAPVQEAETMPTVLVVDDSLTVRKITGRLLAREGYQVITAKDGVDALEHLVETIPDVMLSDIEMPRMDGFDLVRNVRSDPRLANLPVIMITSRTAEKHRSYALEIGANEYLGKPYEEEKLLELIAGFVKQKRAA